MSERRFAIAGSTTRHAADGQWLSADPTLEVTVTVLTRQQQGAGDAGESLLSGAFTALPREQAERMMSASQSDLDAVRAFAGEYGLQVIDESPVAKRVRLRGTIQQMDQAFGVDIQWRIDAEGHKYLTYQGEISLPQSLSGIAVAVLGLDQRAVARPHSKTSAS